jgi:hypothetical protein
MAIVCEYSVLATIAQLNDIMATKELNVAALVNATQQIFAARCTNGNLCVANSTVCTQPACGSNFLQTPGLMCDMNFGSNKSLCGKRCSGLLRSLSSSTVQVAPGLTNNQEAATFVCSTASLTSLFSDLYYNQGVTGWQYVASNTGVTRTYPAAAQSGASCASQDVRQQAWYVSASTGPKDIVFVLDYSDSMNAGDAGPNGMSRLTALKITMNLLLTSLTPADRFNIVTFAQGATIIGPQNGLLAATPGNITAMNNIIQAKRTSGGTTFGPGFEAGFALFLADASSSTGCTRLLMFMTDGQPTDGSAYVGAVARGQASLGSNPAIMFTYSMSRSADETLLRNLACQYSGFWAPVRDGSAAVNPVQQYYNWIAQGILRPQPRWTNPRNSTFGQGLIVTVSQPIFDYSVTPKVYIGVAAIDVLYSELSAVATDAQIAGALKARSEVCLDYDLTGCQRQNLRLNATAPFSCTQDPLPSTCRATSVVVPSCNTTIITNINQVLCEPYNNYTVFTQNDTNLQCCQQAQCFTKSRSVSMTITVSKELTKSRSKTPTARITPSPTISFTPSDEASGTQTRTLTLKSTTTSSIVLTGTQLVTASFTLNKTTSVSVSQSLLWTLTVKHDSRSALVTATSFLSTTNTITPTSSQLLTVTHSAPLTLTEAQTATRTWPCVSSQRLRTAFNFSETVLVLTDQDIVQGFNRTIRLPALKGLEKESLHLPWFQTFTIPLSATPARASKENSDGFALMPGTTANITATFIGGLGTTTLDAANHDTIVSIVCPPHPSFVIYIAEAVELQARLSDITLGQLCGETADDVSPMFVMLINTPNSIILNAGQTVITTTLVLAAPAAAMLAAPDMQVLIMTAMIPCANSYQQRSFALYRAISPFAISDSFEGVLWGNLIANVGFLALHGLIILVMSVAKGITVSGAAELARFPCYSLHMFVLTYPGTAFSTLQLFLEDSASSETLFLAIAMLVIFVLGCPLGALLYIIRNVEAVYYRFQYNRWRREASTLRVRFLSRILMPLGHWDPDAVTKTYGLIITRQCRPEYIWITYPAWSALIVAICGLMDFDSHKLCIMVYAIMLFLHLLILATIVYFRPFRSMIEDWFAALGVAFTCLFVIGTIVNLQLPTSSPAQTFLWSIGIAQLVLLVIRVVYGVAFIFIERNLKQAVPHVEAFRWNMGEIDRNSNVGDDDEMMNALLKDNDAPFGAKFDDLEELLMLESNPGENDDREPREWTPTQLLNGTEMQKSGAQQFNTAAEDSDYMKELYQDREDDNAVALLMSLGVPLSETVATSN